MIAGGQKAPRTLETWKKTSADSDAAATQYFLPYLSNCLFSEIISFDILAIIKIIFLRQGHGTETN